MNPHWGQIHRLRFTKHGLVGEKTDIAKFMDLIQTRQIDLLNGLGLYYISYKVLPEYLLRYFEEENDVRVDREHHIIVASKETMNKVKQKVYNATGVLAPDFCASLCTDVHSIQYPISAIGLEGKHES